MGPREHRCHFRLTTSLLLAAALIGVLPATAARPGGAVPQSPAPDDAFDSYGSYRSARALLERGIESMGGSEALARVGGLVWHAGGTIDKTAERQGLAPAAPSPASYRESLAVDPGRERAAWEYREDRHDGTFEWIREIHEGEDVYRILILQEGFAVEQRGGRFAEERRRIERRAPGLLLEQLLAAPAALRHGGLAPDGSATVTGLLPSGETVTVLLDPDSGVLRQLRYLTDLETLGDALVTWEWSEYREVPGLGLFPGLRTTIIDGRTLVDATLEGVSTGATAVAALFESPDDLEGPFVQDLSAETGVENDPSEEERTDASADARLETLFHNDHAGGVRAFIAEGATVLATPAAAPAVRELVEDTPHTLAPDRLSRSPRPLKLEVVRGRSTISDSTRVMEIIDVGLNPHTEQMLVVYLPAEGIMFVSDLLDPTRVEAFPKPAHAALDRWFAGWLEESGLAPQRIYTMHGSGLVTPEHLARLGMR